MITIPGYHILELIYASSNTLVYRGICQADQQSVIIKVLKSEYPTLSELVRFPNQYRITKNLNLPGIVQPKALVNYHNEQIKLEPYKSAGDRTGLYYLYLNKLTLCYLFGDYQQAVEHAQEAQQYIDEVAGNPRNPFFYFYDSLSWLGLYPETSEPEQEAIISKVAANQQKMQQCADYAPMNFLHEFELVEAERYRVRGEKMEAMEYYDRAIAGAATNEYIQEEALANELAGKFYLAWGKPKIAQIYLTDAYYGYARWGAKAKVEQLEKHYSQFLAPIMTRERGSLTDDTFSNFTTEAITASSSNDSAILDLAE
ncbi:MAG: hypothetical protein F6K14_26665, partial [Symploca sp. SIO2C1]|nr:hypothetical protein [Symploca sp. SIO2C1]